MATVATYSVISASNVSSCCELQFPYISAGVLRLPCFASPDAVTAATVTVEGQYKQQLLTAIMLSTGTHVAKRASPSASVRS